MKLNSTSLSFSKHYSVHQFADTRGKVTFYFHANHSKVQNRKRKRAVSLLIALKRCVLTQIRNEKLKNFFLFAGVFNLILE